VTSRREALAATLPPCADPGPRPTNADSLAVHRPRLRHPDLVFYVDVTITEYEGRWLATAMLADEPDIGTGDDPREALKAVLAALGEPYASVMAAGARMP
jgi:hypothetical protein